MCLCAFSLPSETTRRCSQPLSSLHLCNMYLSEAIFLIKGSAWQQKCSTYKCFVESLFTVMGSSGRIFAI